ncbi:hypothetical protein BCL93_109107 [Onishia taeanensis]|uniref:Uncharacterized protein n=1 Tax=Onishia taeanensis TaxID=284577 RepID=A0A328XLA4_9GAMM|nr:hypothetical protein [Halomonas taeanensis]RAR59549.1 hypothetical protein BCL93_109107 [Halomonas taeanensis]
MEASRSIKKGGYRKLHGSALTALVLAGLVLVPATVEAESLILREATTSPLDEDIYTNSHADIIPLDDMEELRGGFSIGGVDVDFGATLQTKIDGMVRMKTQLAFSQSGINVVSEEISNLSPNVTSISPNGTSVTQVAPKTFNLAGLADFSGVAFSDAGSFTAALHNITRNAIISAVVSNGSGQNISQSIDVSVTLRNAETLQASQAQAAIMRSFGRF